MINAVTTVWAQRSPRERLLLALLGFVALSIVYWLVAWRPLHAAADGAQVRLEQQISDYRALQAALPTLQAQASSPNQPAAPLRQLLSDSAARKGLTLARVQPDGAGLAVGLDGAAPTALWSWLIEVEQAGATVSRLSVRKGEGETLDAQVTFGGGT